MSLPRRALLHACARVFFVLCARVFACVAGPLPFVVLPRRYADTAERLQAESGVNLTRFDVADNIDLMFILAVRRTWTRDSNPQHVSYPSGA